MTPEFPELQTALVRAARRRIRRRRRLQVVVPTLVAAAAAAAVVIGLPQPKDVERPAVTPKDVLEQSFSAFRRPRTAADALPPQSVISNLDLERSRLAARSGDAKLYVVPRHKPVDLCLFLVLPGKAPEGVCRPRSAAVAEATPLNVAFDGYHMLFMPDGTTDVRISGADGSFRAVQLKDNAALVPDRPSDDAVGWTGPLNRRYVLRQQITEPLGPTPQGCPALDALPADALTQAKRAALLAVDRLYPAIREAIITSAARAPGTPCSPAITRNSILVKLYLITVDPSKRKSASLSQGRLLLGVVHGRMTVYALQH